MAKQPQRAETPASGGPDLDGKSNPIVGYAQTLERRVAWMKIDAAGVTPPTACATRGNAPPDPVQGPVCSADVFLGCDWDIGIAGDRVFVTHRSQENFGRLLEFPYARVREIMWESIDGE